jgi:hypothetical protein
MASQCFKSSTVIFWHVYYVIESMTQLRYSLSKQDRLRGGVFHKYHLHVIAGRK